jgi:hypothetical protein
MDYAYTDKNKMFRLALPVVLALALICEVAGAAVKADFNGDGYDDLVISATKEDLSNLPDAGAIHVIYGGLSSSSSYFNQFWHQNVGGVEDSAGADEQFGRAVATGDFNNDGYDDLAVGVPGDDWVNPLLLTVRDKAGGVNVFYGAYQIGLTLENNQFWTQNSQGILDNVEPEDRFGSALAAGDFDSDGFDDLAIGVPREDVDGVNNAGAVNVLYGTQNGLSAAGDQFWHQGSSGVQSAPATGEMFGSKLVAGDFDNDGTDDLAIGVNYENINGKEDAGAVNILYGTEGDGLTGVDDQFWHEDNLIGEAKAYDYFGSSLTVGKFNGDAYDDLAIGIPFKDASTNITNVGAALVLYGSSGGLSTIGIQMWMQDPTGSPESYDDDFGAREKDDIFSWALTSGDFNGDNIDDLAIGVPGEDYLRGNVAPFETGAVNIIYGTPLGLDSAGRQFWNQDKDGITGVGEDYDWYGTALATGDYNNDGYDDLAIAIPFEDIPGPTPDFENRKDAGEVRIRYGSDSGICKSNEPGCLYGEIFTQNLFEIAEPGDSLGTTLD